MGKKTDDVESVNHSKCMLAAFQNFRQDETMLDVTLVCNGMSLKAHKLVLSACSPLFKEILSDNPCAHPVIILRSFEFVDLKAIIEFIYKGKLSVPRERLLLALKVAEELQIRGLQRSEPSTEKYEKLYKQVRGKSSHKKRKRLRRNSTDSEGNECVSIPDSDRRVSESYDASSGNEETRTESLEAMDVDSARLRESAEVDRLVRPVVLRVGDPVANNEELIRRNLNEEEGSTVEMKTVSDHSSQNECSASLIDNVKDPAYESSSENAATTSKFHAFAGGSDVLPDCIDVDEQFNVQEHSSDSLPVTEYADEQDGLISSSCLSPKSTETQQIEEVRRFKDEGKKFICSKCDRVFTSRINFMQHKAMGHNNSEKRKAYECKLCDFTSEDIGGYKEHLQLHSDKVPYKCSSCPEEFTSEDLYKEHLSLHKEEILFSSVQDFFSTEKVLEFRCSICFQRFKSKLSCQLHEKSCQGGN